MNKIHKDITLIGYAENLYWISMKINNNNYRQAHLGTPNEDLYYNPFLNGCNHDFGLRIFPFQPI